MKDGVVGLGWWSVVGLLDVMGAEVWGWCRRGEGLAGCLAKARDVLVDCDDHDVDNNAGIVIRFLNLLSIPRARKHTRPDRHSDRSRLESVANKFEVPDAGP